MWYASGSTRIGLEMTAALKEVLEHAFTQGEFEMAGIVDISQDEDGQGFDVKMDWVGFDEGDSSWERLRIYGTVPRSLSSRSCAS